MQHFITIPQEPPLFKIFSRFIRAFYIYRHINIYNCTVCVHWKSLQYYKGEDILWKNIENEKTWLWTPTERWVNEMCPKMRWWVLSGKMWRRRCDSGWSGARQDCWCDHMLIRGRRKSGKETECSYICSQGLRSNGSCFVCEVILNRLDCMCIY